MTSKESIDLKMALKSLPMKCDFSNIDRIQLINFTQMQRSLISFQHDDQDELFNYYDNRNKQRLRQLNTNAIETEIQTDEIKSLSSTLLSIVTQIVQRSAQ